MENFKHISFWEIIGPVVATLATIIALYGDPYKTNAKGVKRLNRLGLVILILAIIGFVITIKSNSDANKSNQKSIDMVKENFLNIKQQNNDLLKNDSIYASSKDSLNCVIRDLRIQLIDVTSKRLVYDENLRIKKQKILIENIFAEIKFNRMFLSTLKDDYLKSFINNDNFVVGSLNDKAMLNSFDIDLSDDVRYQINKILKKTTILNSDISEAGQEPKGERKSMLIRQIIRNRDFILDEYNYIETRIKYN